jgi:hypothetical protein
MVGQPIVTGKRVGENSSIPGNVLHSLTVKGCSVYVLYRHCSADSIPFNKNRNRLLGTSTTPLALALLTRPAADVSFVNLNGTRKRGRHRFFPHSLSNPMAEEPWRLLSNAEFAGHLLASNAFFAAGHRTNGRQRPRQQNPAFLKDRADPNRELLSARLALIDARPYRVLACTFGGQRVDLLALAVRADRAG